MAIDYHGFRFPKGATRREDKRKRLAEERRIDKAARDEAWKRCRGRCEKCGRRVTRRGDLIHGAEFHHRVPRSQGGRKRPVYLVTCHGCHFDGPSGAHTRTR